MINRDADAVERGEVPGHIRKAGEDEESGEEKFMEGVEVGKEEEKRDITREVGREGGVPIITEEDREREGSGSETMQGSPHAQGERKVVDEEQDYREENMPDGRETVQEWKEGPHKIIERRAGPGEEVEVEVQRNAYAKHPDAEPVTTKAFRGTEGHAHQVARQFMHGLMHAPKDAEKAVERVEEVAESAVENLSPHLSPKHAEQHPKPAEGVAGPSGTSGGAGPGGEDAGEDEEGWASDATAERHKGGKRSGSSPGARPGKRRLFMHGVGRIGRRKSSAHTVAHSSGGGRGISGSRPSSGSSTGGLLAGRHSPVRQASPSPGPSTPIATDYASTAQSQPPLSLTQTQSIPHIETELAGASASSSPEDNSPAQEETRGRPAPSPRPDAGGRRRSRQHQRLDTLRRQGGGSFGSRDSSPARSVRWADDPGLRSPLPLSPTSPTGTGEGYESAREGGESGDEDGEVGAGGQGREFRSSVRFELPDLGEGGR